jgi:hypothetical protein
MLTAIHPTFKWKRCAKCQTSFFDMKKVLFVLVVFLSFHHVQAQVQNLSSAEQDLYSNTEKFSDSAGRLIQKEYIRVGNVLDCVIEVLHITDVINGTKMSAIRFSDPQGRVTLLDADEIYVLDSSMKTIRDKILPAVPANYTETYYKSRSGFEAGCYTDKGQWKPYIRLKRNDNTAYVFMKKADFDIFIRILDNAKAKL